MFNMKTTECPKCGGMVLKLAGKAGDMCHDLCLKCREKADALGIPTTTIQERSDVIED